MSELITLYKSKLTCGCHDVVIHDRYPNATEATAEAQNIMGLTLKESRYTLLLRVVRETQEAPFQETLREWTRDVGAEPDGPTHEGITWRESTWQAG